MSKNKVNLILAIILTSLIFVMGIFLGGKLFESKIQDLQEMQGTMSSEILDIEMSYELASESLCDNSAILKLNQELDEAGRRVIFLDKKKSSRDPEFLNFKKHYFILELKHWQLIKRINEECDISHPVILYFYQIGTPAVEIQGTVLNSLKSNNPEVMIYSFDITSELESLNIIKSKYNITRAPALVINDRLLTGVQDEDRILNIIS